MSDLTAKAAYLKGLADGMKLDENTDTNKLIKAMIEMFGDMADKIEALDSEVEFLADSIDDIDDELDEIADILSDCAGGDCDCGLSDDENNCFELICPACNKNIILNMDEFEDEIACPLCGEEIEFDFDFNDNIDEEN